MLGRGRTRRILVAVGAAGATLALGAAPARADVALTCPTVITSGGTYALMGDLVCPHAAQVEIQTSDAVTVDLRGYTLYGSINATQDFGPGPNTVLLENGTMADYLYVNRTKVASVHHVRFRNPTLPFDPSWDAVVVEGTASVSDSTFLHCNVFNDPSGTLVVRHSSFYGGRIASIQALSTLVAGNVFYGGGSIFLYEDRGSVLDNVLYGGTITVSHGISVPVPDAYTIGGNTVIGPVVGPAITTDAPTVPVIDLGGDRIAHVSADPPCIGVVCTPLYP